MKDPAFALAFGAPREPSTGLADPCEAYDALPDTQAAPAAPPSTMHARIEAREPPRPGSVTPDASARKEQLRLVLHRGCAFVAWVDRTTFGFGALWFARSLDGGATFEPEIALSLGAGAPREAQIAVAGERVTVAWIEDGGGDSRIWTATSHDGGERFGEPSTLGESSAPRTERR